MFAIDSLTGTVTVIGVLNTAIVDNYLLEVQTREDLGIPASTPAIVKNKQTIATSIYLHVSLNTYRFSLISLSPKEMTIIPCLTSPPTQSASQSSTPSA